MSGICLTREFIRRLLKAESILIAHSSSLHGWSGLFTAGKLCRLLKCHTSSNTTSWQSPNILTRTDVNRSTRCSRLIRDDLVSAHNCSELYIRQFSRLVSSSVLCHGSKPNDSNNTKRYISKTDEWGTHGLPKLSPFKSEVQQSKRFVGRSSRFHDDDVNNHSISISTPRYRINDRTKALLKNRVSRLQNNILLQKAKLRDKIKAQKVQKENIKTIPNLLTTLRMASSPVLAYLVVNESFGLACSIFVVAGITDLLDGFIARNFKNQTSALGTALDPLADKLLISFLTVSLTSVGLIPVPVTALILSRDASLIIGAFYIRYISLAPPRTISRYFDVSHVTARLYPSKISKVNTVLQLSFVTATLASPVFEFVGHPVLQVLMYMTATTTFLSWADYVVTWRRRLQIVKN